MNAQWPTNPFEEIVPAIGETVKIVERIVPIYNYKGYMQ